MTREEKMKILSEAQDRAFRQIELTEGCEMGSEDFGRLLYAAQTMDWLTGGGNPVPEGECVCRVGEEDEEPAEDVNLPKVKTERIGNVMVSEVVEPVPETPSMSKEELRDKLSTYSNKYGFLDVAQTMNDMGYSKLSEVPQSEYAELLERIENCIKVGV